MLGGGGRGCALSLYCDLSFVPTAAPFPDRAPTSRCCCCCRRSCLLHSLSAHCSSAHFTQQPVAASHSAYAWASCSSKLIIVSCGSCAAGAGGVWGGHLLPMTTRRRRLGRKSARPRWECSRWMATLRCRKRRGGGGAGGFVTGSTARHMLRAWSCTIGPLCEIRRHVSYAAAKCYSLRACMRNSRTRVE